MRRYRKHVVMEKPMALAWDDLARMKAVADENARWKTDKPGDIINVPAEPALTLHPPETRHHLATMCSQPRRRRGERNPEVVRRCGGRNHGRQRGRIPIANRNLRGDEEQRCGRSSQHRAEEALQPRQDLLSARATPRLRQAFHPPSPWIESGGAVVVPMSKFGYRTVTRDRTAANGVIRGG